MPMKDVKWCAEIKAISIATTEALKATDEILQYIVRNVVGSNDVLQRNLPDAFARPFDRLCTCLRTVDEEASSAFEHYSSRANGLMLIGYLISREDFHLLSAMFEHQYDEPFWGVQDYESFCMFHYEDETTRGYINPQTRPHQEGMSGMRFGIPPEEIKVANLSVAQRRYFEAYPEILSRFQE
jgi:hypothetical protein